MGLSVIFSRKKLLTFHLFSLSTTTKPNTFHYPNPKSQLPNPPLNFYCTASLSGDLADSDIVNIGGTSSNCESESEGILLLFTWILFLFLIKAWTLNLIVKESQFYLRGIHTDMAMNCVKSLRNITITKELVLGRRTFAVGKAKKGSKGSGAADGPKASSLSKEVKSTTVVGANILKEGTDPKILADSDYPDWLPHLLDKRPALSELRRKNTQNLTYEDLKRFVKLDNRARIKENNSVKAKN